MGGGEKMEEHECSREGDPQRACAGEVLMRAVAFPAEPTPWCEAHWAQILRKIR